MTFLLFGLSMGEGMLISDQNMMLEMGLYWKCIVTVQLFWVFLSLTTELVGHSNM